jgi:hypothetical protein
MDMTLSQNLGGQVRISQQTQASADFSKSSNSQYITSLIEEF